MNIVTISSIPFDPKPDATTAVNAIANDVYNTPEELRIDLGQITRLNYLDAEVVGSLIFDAAESVCAGNIRITDGATDFHTEPFTVTAATRVDFKTNKLNLKNVNGNTPLYIALDITTAATVAVTAELFAQLRIQSPLIVSD